MTRNVPVPAPIRAMVIAIPANDEEQRIVNCVESVRESVAQIAGSVRSVVVVACDSCTDTTTALVEELAGAATNLCVVEGEWGSAGGARRAAIAFGLGAIEADGPVSASSIWLATTDGDTYVPVDWLRRHLDHADAGADAVAGTVELIDDLDRSPEVIELFRETYELGATSHSHVHGANLGIRASAYLEVGGFAGIPVSEDHALWNDLRRRRFLCVSPLDVRVNTSARLRGRASGGFADTIAAALAG